MTFNGPAGCVSSQSGKLTLMFLYGTRWNANPGKELNVVCVFAELFGSVATITENEAMQRHQLLGSYTLIPLFTFAKGCEVSVNTLPKADWYTSLDPQGILVW